MLTDPIADLLTRIRNANMASQDCVEVPASRIKANIVKVLQDEGYILGFSESEVDGKPFMSVELKYFEGQPVIRRLERVSRPSLRIYKAMDALPDVENGLGIAVVSTSKGVMTVSSARAKKLGGEVLCIVS